MPTKSASKTITRDQTWLGPAIPPGEIIARDASSRVRLSNAFSFERLGRSGLYEQPAT